DPSIIPPLLLAYAIATVGVEFATVFNNAMMPTLVPPERIGRLSGTGWATGYIGGIVSRSEEHTSELQSQSNLVCRLVLEKKSLIASSGSKPVDKLTQRNEISSPASKMPMARFDGVEQLNTVPLSTAPSVNLVSQPVNERC